MPRQEHRPLTALKRLRVAKHEEYGLRQTLQNREIALVKSKGPRRENLQQSDDLTLVPDGCGHYGANAESSTDHVLDAGIVLGVVAPQSFSCSYAFPGKTRVDIYMGSDLYMHIGQTFGDNASPADLLAAIPPKALY